MQIQSQVVINKKLTNFYLSLSLVRQKARVNSAARKTVKLPRRPASYAGANEIFRGSRFVNAGRTQSPRKNKFMKSTVRDFPAVNSPLRDLSVFETVIRVGSGKQTGGSVIPR